MVGTYFLEKNKAISEKDQSRLTYPQSNKLKTDAQDLCSDEKADEEYRKFLLKQENGTLAGMVAMAARLRSRSE